MKRQLFFSNELITAFENAMDVAKQFNIERSTPIVILKGILDLEVNPLYDYLMENTAYDSSDLEMAFIDTLYSLDLIKEEQEEANDEEQEEPIAENDEEEKYCFIFDETSECLVYSEEVAILITRAIQIAQEEKSDCVLLEYFLKAIAENVSKDIVMFLRNVGVNIKNFKNTFNKVSSKEKSILPRELQPFMKVLNEGYKKNTRCSILGRDKECEVIWKTMQKKTKRNVILIGKPGVGKSAIVKKITHDIVNEVCPECFKNYYVISIDVNAIIAGTTYRGQAEERFRRLTDFLENTENVILFIDEIHTILGAGSCNEGGMDLANALKPILAEDKVKVIGATTLEEYKKYFSKDGALKRRFHSIEVKEPTSKKVYPMLKNAVSDLSKYHNVRITKAIVEYIILISSCFHHETSNPDRTIDLVDLAMVTAKTAGKKYVDKESVLKNFEINFEKFEKMDYKIKKSTAYHEAGHYLIWKFSKNLIDLEGIAVSIMPANTYLGITVYDELDDEVTASGNMDYFIDSIALDLGGRVAEKMYTNTISSGASADLESATRYAYSVVARYGMSEDFGKNRVYFDSENYTMHSEKVVDNINLEIDKIIDKAYKRAEQILTENEVYLKKLVNLLMKKGIVSRKDLDNLFKEKDHQKINS